MTPKGANDGREAEPDRVIARLATQQHGVVAGWQLLELGISRNHLRTRRETGRLHACFRGVYAVGHSALTQSGRWMAAVLACGAGAVLSYWSAGSLWRLGRFDVEMIHVSICAAGGRKRRRGLMIHRQPSLRGDETTQRDGIPVTTPARTLLDLARVLPDRRLERAIDEADRLRLCGAAELAAIAAAHTGEPGSGRLSSVLASHAIGSTLTRSELEEGFLRLCRGHRLPPPQINVPLLDYVVDFYWPDRRLAVELDGHASHGTRAAFERDRDRDTHLAAHGYRTLRFTWRDVTARPAIVVDRVRRVLEGDRLTP